jgi:hypothetical protein
MDQQNDRMDFFRQIKKLEFRFSISFGKISQSLSIVVALDRVVKIFLWKIK